MTSSVLYEELQDALINVAVGSLWLRNNGKSRPDLIVYSGSWGLFARIVPVFFDIY